jgi:hypothetical protein
MAFLGPIRPSRNDEPVIVAMDIAIITVKVRHAPSDGSRSPFLPSSS